MRDGEGGIKRRVFKRKIIREVRRLEENSSAQPRSFEPCS